MNIPRTPNTTASALPGTVGLGINAVMLFSNAAAPGDDIYLESATLDRCQGHPTQRNHINLQTSTAATSAGRMQWFLTTGVLRGQPGTCTGC